MQNISVEYFRSPAFSRTEYDYNSNRQCAQKYFHSLSFQKVTNCGIDSIVKYKKFNYQADINLTHSVQEDHNLSHEVFLLHSFLVVSIRGNHFQKILFRGAAYQILADRRQIAF